MEPPLIERERVKREGEGEETEMGEYERIERKFEKKKKNKNFSIYVCTVPNPC